MAKINVKEGNGANLMLLSSRCDAFTPTFYPSLPFLLPLFLSWGLHSYTLMSFMYTQWPDASRDPLAHIPEWDTPDHQITQTHYPSTPPSSLCLLQSVRHICCSKVAVNIFIFANGIKVIIIKRRTKYNLIIFNNNKT